MTLLYAYATVEHGRSCWLLVIPRCPFCRTSHVHGGGPLAGDPRPYLSSRVPHCAHPAKSFDDMYWLTDDATLHGRTVPACLYAEIGA